MNFLQRLIRYLIGLAIGLVLVFIFFGQRSCGGWTPQNRVKNVILGAEIKMEPQLLCRVECLADSAGAALELVKAGEVVFAESQVQEEPKTYRVAGSVGRIEAIDFELHGDSLVWITEVFPESINCPCPD